MVRAKFSLFIAMAGVTILAGCEEGAFPSIASQSASAIDGTPPPATLVEQDVEAPDVFAANEAALWDGRPSLGGVWVAHPEVADPERVRITNEANGNVVIGALFRRERDNPGPRIQVSSDAAAALGLLAGQPSVLDVVALRREEVVVPGAVPELDPELIDEEAEIIIEEPLEDAPAEDEGPIEETTLEDPIAAAEAAILAASNEALAEAAPDAEASPIDRAEPEAVAEIAPEPTAESEVIAAAVPASNAAMEPLASLAPERLPDPLPEPTNVQLTAATAIAEIEEAEPATEAAPAVVESAAATPAQNLDKPFIQIGIFNVEDNAESTATVLRQAGVIPLVRAQDSSGNPFWRVVVGPATSSDEQGTLMAKVRELGFEDAYLVTN